MSGNLRDLARRALSERRPEHAVDAAVERVVIDVRLGDRTELVTLAVREERLVVLASDGAASTSPAARAALEWLAAEPLRTSLVPMRPGPSAPVALPTGKLDAAIGDLTTAVMRSGTSAPEAPAILDAFARIARASPSIEISRWVGRLRAALAARDETLVARLLDGAAELAIESEPTRLVDHVLVELGREVLDGIALSSIERRHLVDPASGEVLSEDHLREQPASTGPCPRVVNAGLLMVSGARRARIVQYAVAPLDAETLARIDALASPSIADAFTRALASITGARFAAIEPASIVRVARAADGEVRDAADQPIALARHEDPGAATALLDALGKGEPAWVFGRWSFASEEASLVPLSCCVSGRVVRLR